MKLTLPDLYSLIRRLALCATFEDADVAAIKTLAVVSRRFEAKTHIVCEGDRSRRFCSFIISGVVLRYKLTNRGSQQIVGIHLPGELLDHADFSLQALTQVHIADIIHDALCELILSRPAVARALWIDSLVNAAIYREWILNNGKREARTRVAHPLCEIPVRSSTAAIAEEGQYTLFRTQEKLAEATGLTQVHIIRTMKLLRVNNLIRQDDRGIEIIDGDGLRKAADLVPSYLHLDKSAPQFAARIKGVSSGSR